MSTASAPLLVSDTTFVDPTRLGSVSAVQPLSGITRVDESFVVNGHGRGGYVRTEETVQDNSKSPL
jgi:hypothetical protein